ncbi:50S ribosomal protein L13-like protein [Perkinsela sp. CCAP 1560/4]|nr:50S ribosomal protein L13-like protein [Perkinsela sp. CCAP 1560/4]KNH09060.1 50S ribosomal protein L13-like protein [Perkinsela sp. CCAP 1560/4]|eukprot:KNH06781.1 50S ribosomal protein L13-like protein [Perkinsela sp. CCAP 1560/4]
MLRRTELLNLTTFRCGKRNALRRHKDHPHGQISYNETSAHYINRASERWWILDATGMQMANLVRTMSYYIQGRHRCDFVQGNLMGDHIVVINCKDVIMVGEDSIRVPITWNSNYPGGKYRVRCSEMYDRDPCMLVFYFLMREIKDHGWNKAEHLYKGHLEKAWLYTDHIHPHMLKNPRPVPWTDNCPFYHKWGSPENQTRWFPNIQMR